MFTEKVKYTDFDGEQQERTLYFHLSKPELARLNLSSSGGLEKYVNRIIEERDGAQLLDLFERIIQMSYGEKSLDGQRFVKSKEATQAFIESPAYEVMYMKLAGDADYAAKFIKGIVPSDVAANMPK